MSTRHESQKPSLRSASVRRIVAFAVIAAVAALPARPAHASASSPIGNAAGDAAGNAVGGAIAVGVGVAALVAAGAGLWWYLAHDSDSGSAPPPAPSEASLGGATVGIEATSPSSASVVTKW